MSQLGSIIRDDATTTFTRAQSDAEFASHSHGLQVLHDQIHRVYVHDCTEEDAQRVLRMSNQHHFLVRKSKEQPDGKRVYKVAVYDQERSDVYDESLALTLLHHYPQRFIAKGDTIELFHSIRTPPHIQLQGGGQEGTPSMFLHASDMEDKRVKSLLQGHFSKNRDHDIRKSMQHVLLRLEDAEDPREEQWVDAFYTPSPSTVGADAQKVPVYTKRMPLHKAASRFMDAVVVPSFPALGGGGDGNDDGGGDGGDGGDGGEDSDGDDELADPQQDRDQDQATSVLGKVAGNARKIMNQREEARITQEAMDRLEQDIHKSRDEYVQNFIMLNTQQMEKIQIETAKINADIKTLEKKWETSNPKDKEIVEKRKKHLETLRGQHQTMLDQLETGLEEGMNSFSEQDQQAVKIFNEYLS